MDYCSENQSKHLLIAHVIFVCKYRKSLLLKLGAEVKDIMQTITKEHEFIIETMEVDKDHIHFLLRYSPSQSILGLVRLMKQISTYRIWRNADNAAWLSKHFWKEKTFLSDGYFACSAGNASAATIAHYIENQG